MTTILCPLHNVWGCVGMCGGVGVECVYRWWWRKWYLPHTQSNVSATGDREPQSRAHPLQSSGYTHSMWLRTLPRSSRHRIGYSLPCWNHHLHTQITNTCIKFTFRSSKFASSPKFQASLGTSLRGAEKILLVGFAMFPFQNGMH